MVAFPLDFTLQLVVREGGRLQPQFGLVGDPLSFLYNCRNCQTSAGNASPWMQREVEGAVREVGVAGVG